MSQATKYRMHATAGIPFNVIKKHAQKAGQVKSKGRLEACTPQSSIAITIRNQDPTGGRVNGQLHSEEYENKNTVLAPYNGSKAISRVMRGDLLFAPLDGWVARRLTAGQPTVHCIHAQNGISTNLLQKFVGVATNAGMKHTLENDSLDDAAAANIGGTQTITNTGPDPIPAFSLIWADTNPFMVQDKDGNMIPGVVEIGHDPNMFRPATYALNYGSVVSMMQYIHRRISELVIDFSKKPLNASVEASLMLKINNTIDSLGIKKDMPLHIWALLDVVRCFISLQGRDNQGSGIGHPGYSRTIVYKCLKMYMDWRYKLKFKFDSAVNGTLEKPAVLKADVATDQVLILTILFQGMMEAQSMQHDYMNARVVGMSLNAAETGKPLDTQLRVYHS